MDDLAVAGYKQDADSHECAQYKQGFPDRSDEGNGLSEMQERTSGSVMPFRKH